MTVVKYASEAWALRKADENLLDIFQRNCLRPVSRYPEQSVGNFSGKHLVNFHLLFGVPMLQSQVLPKGLIVIKNSIQLVKNP